MNIVSYAARRNTLLINIPVFLQKETSSLYELYRIDSIPIPLDNVKVTREQSWKGTYTQIQFSKEYFAISGNKAVMISEQDLRSCVEFGTCLLYTSDAADD